LITVIGDIMLDITSKCDVLKSKEYNGYTLRVRCPNTYKVGGAANVATNLKSPCHLISSVFTGDLKGTPFDYLESKNITCSFIEDRARCLTKKHRFYKADTIEQYARVDTEVITPIAEPLIPILVNSINKDSKGVILSDYEKGVLTNQSIKEIKAFCQKYNIPVFVDPKDVNLFEYTRAEIIKMNEPEFVSKFGKVEGHSLTEAINFLKCKHLVVTRSANSVFCISEQTQNDEYTLNHQIVNIPEIKHNVSTVGAGDAFMASLVENYISNSDLMTSINQANKHTAQYLITNTVYLR